MLVQAISCLFKVITSLFRACVFEAVPYLASSKLVPVCSKEVHACSKLFLKCSMQVLYLPVPSYFLNVSSKYCNGLFYLCQVPREREFLLILNKYQFKLLIKTSLIRSVVSRSCCQQPGCPAGGV